MNKTGLNTKQVGKLFRVDESTIRRWAILGKIKCNTSAGGHRKFSYKNLIEFAKKNNFNVKAENQYDLNNEKNTIKKILKCTLNQEDKFIESILVKLYLEGKKLNKIMDTYVEPTLVKIQKKLDQKEISVAEEHIARKIISKALNSFRLSLYDDENKNGKNVLCLNLENDIPDLPIDMIQILLEELNYSVDNCGSHTSIKDIRKLLKNKKYEFIYIYLCDRQCCTSTIKDNIKKTNQNLQKISDLGRKYNIKLFLGGPSFNNIDKNILSGYRQFFSYTESVNF